MAISAILAGLAIYGVSLMKSFENEQAYNRLSNKEKQVVDSLKRVGVDEDEIKENISLMSSALETLRQVQRAIDTQKDFESDVKSTFQNELNRRKAMRINSWQLDMGGALDNLNKINPKIFDTREIRAKLEQAKKELNAL